ncbi:MAG: hypothetical protein JRG68_03070 [Deltaproteobacteria bacterium]|nr:hypothetical protein [Deltaproteobacteria bacterium]
MIKKILILLMFSLVVLGCRQSSLNLKIRYDQIQGLKKGDRVIFERNHIGIVTDVSYSVDAYYMVDVSIKNDFANAATEHSVFFITTDPQNKNKKAVEMIQLRKGGSPLQEGAIVFGSTKSSAIFHQMWSDLENKMDVFKKDFEQFLEDLSRIPESEKFKTLEKELDRLAEEMKRSGEAVQEKIRKELLPKLREELEKLREKLQESGREDELKPLETKMEKIRGI